MSTQTQQHRRAKRHARVRARVSGTAERPRISVFRSNRGIYAQLIDDVNGVTLASADSRDVEGADLDKTAVAGKVGELLAERSRAAGVERAVFDRSGYLYHGRVKALAEGARKAGLQF